MSEITDAWNNLADQTGESDQPLVLNGFKHGALAIAGIVSLDVERVLEIENLGLEIPNFPILNFFGYQTTQLSKSPELFMLYSITGDKIANIRLKSKGDDQGEIDAQKVVINAWLESNDAIYRELTNSYIILSPEIISQLEAL